MTTAMVPDTIYFQHRSKFILALSRFSQKCYVIFSCVCTCGEREGQREGEKER